MHYKIYIKRCIHSVKVGQHETWLNCNVVLLVSEYYHLYAKLIRKKVLIGRLTNGSLCSEDKNDCTYFNVTKIQRHNRTTSYENKTCITELPKTPKDTANAMRNAELE